MEPKGYEAVYTIFDQGTMVRQRIHLIWALPAAEQTPESSSLQERCIFTIPPVLNPGFRIVRPVKSWRRDRNDPSRLTSVTGPD